MAHSPSIYLHNVKEQTRRSLARDRLRCEGEPFGGQMRKRCRTKRATNGVRSATAEARLPLRHLLVGDLGEQHVRRLDRLARLELIQKFAPSLRPATG